MSFNRAKTLGKAQKYLQKGKLNDAIKEFLILVNNDPSDIRTLLKVGDLYVKTGSISDACETYQKVAHFYAKDGFFLKAVAVYKQLLKIDPSSIETYCKLAELYQKLSLKSEAIKQYQAAAKQYESQGQIKSSLDVLKKMSALEPEDYTNRSKLAELYLREGHKEDAVETFTEMTVELKDKQLFDHLSQVYEKMIQLNLAQEDEIYELIETYLESKEAQKALKMLQGLFQKNSRDIRTLDLLARCFSDLDQFEKSRSIYVEILEILESDGKAEEKEVYEAKMRALDVISSGSEQVEASSSEFAQPVASIDVSEIKEVNLAEIETFLEYGLADKAINILSQALFKDPSRQDLLQKLESIASEHQLSAKVTPILSEIKSKAAQIQPQNEGGFQSVEVVEEAFSDQTIVDDSMLSQVDSSEIDDAPAIEFQDDFSRIEVLDTEFEVGDFEEELEAPLEETKSTQSDLQDLHLEEELESSAFEEETSLDDNQSLEVEMDEQVSLGNVDLDLIEDVSMEDPILLDLSEEVSLDDNASFELSTNEIPNNVIDFGVTTSELEDGFERKESDHEFIEPESEEISSEVSQPEKEAEEDFFDLSSELKDEIADLESEDLDSNSDDDHLSPEDVLKEFKKGVSRVVAKDDHQTHYNLGIAYKEMGLLDEAIVEFGLASGEKSLTYDCTSMIGLCLMGKQHHKAAIKIYKKTLAHTLKEHESYSGLCYQLAEAFIGDGQIKKAFESFRLVYNQDPNFRDIKKRFKELALEFGEEDSDKEEVENTQDSNENSNKVSFI